MFNVVFPQEGSGTKLTIQRALIGDGGGGGAFLNCITTDGSARRELCYIITAGMTHREPCYIAVGMIDTNRAVLHSSRNDRHKESCAT